MITQPTTSFFKQHYIWKTAGDKHVRGSHAARAGRIFAWNNPPDGGHPGEDYGCRCWAEPTFSSRPKGLTVGYDDVYDKELFLQRDAINPTWSPLDFIGGITFFITRTGSKITITYAKKGIERQIVKRGWTKNLIQKTINKPYKKIKTKDVRRSKNGSRKNEASTAYINRDGSYVVRNDITGDIVQISDKTKPNWKPSFKIGE